MAIQWIRSKGVIWEELDGQAVLISPAAGKRWTLNAMAAGLWKACDGTRDLAHLAAQFAQAGGRSADEMTHEIAQFCLAFSRLGLLCNPEASPSPGPLGSCAPFTVGRLFSAMFSEHQLAGTTRRRPSPRGISGPG